MKKLLVIIGLSLLSTYAFCQQSKTLFQVGVNGLTANSKSIYHNGFGINANILFPLSPSFNLGPEVSYYNIDSRVSSASIQPISVRLHVAYFPEKLLKKITKDSSAIARGLYFDAGLGHAFNVQQLSNDDVLNSSNIGVGYLFCQSKRSLFVKLSVSNFALSNAYTDEQKMHNDIYTLTIGFSLSKFKSK